MLRHSVELYDKLEAETGQAIDWKKYGSLRLACSEQREMENRRLMTMAKSFGLEMQWLSPKQAQELFPLMSDEDVRSAIYHPQRRLYRSRQRRAGAWPRAPRTRAPRSSIGERATGFKVENDRVTRVETDKGAWTCDLLVNACGMWGHEVGQPGRRARAVLRGRASVPDHRSDPRRAEAHADHARPGSPGLLQAGGARAGGRRL